MSFRKLPVTAFFAATQAVTAATAGPADASANGEYSSTSSSSDSDNALAFDGAVLSDLSEVSGDDAAAGQLGRQVVAGGTGAATLWQAGGRTRLVGPQIDYRDRTDDAHHPLAAYNAIEFMSTVGKVRCATAHEDPADGDAPAGAGRPRNMRAPLGAAHPQHEEFELATLSKYATAVLVGYRKVRYGSDRFVRLALTLFAPWDVTTKRPAYPMTWDGFLAFKADCELTHIGRCRLRMLAQVVQGLQVGSWAKSQAVVRDT
jgi:hypothetical protein